MSQIIQMYIEVKSYQDYELLEKIIHRLGYKFYLPPKQDKLPKTLEDIILILENEDLLLSINRP